MLLEPLIGREHFLCNHGHVRLGYLATPDQFLVISDLTEDPTQRAAIGKNNRDAVIYCQWRLSF